MRTHDLSRRSFLAIAAALPFSAAAALRGAKNVPVGLELFSVRGELAKDLLGTVAAVGKMGYQVVEFYAPYLEWTPETAKNVRKVLDDSGLKCHSTHNNGPSFTPDGLKKAIDLNQIIGSKTLIMASAPRATAIDQWKALGDQLTAISAQLKPIGMATDITITRSNGVWWTASGRWTCSPRARRPTWCCSSTSAPAWRSAPTRSPGSRRTPAGSRASTAATGRRKGYNVAFGEGTRRGRRSSMPSKRPAASILPGRAGNGRHQRRRASHGSAARQLEEAARLT